MKRWIRSWLYRWTGLSEVLWLQDSELNQTPDRFLVRASEYFQAQAELVGQLPDPEPGTVFVCTHHTGAMDILALYPYLRQCATHLRIIVNKELMALRVLTPIFIPVMPPSYQFDNQEGRVRMIEHLKAGGNLLIYPAGKIATRRNGEIVDEEWRHGSAEIIQNYAKRIVPLYVEAKNHNSFYRIRRVFPRLSLLFILRALKHRPKQNVRVHFGKSVPVQSLENLAPKEAMQTLRRKTDELIFARH